MHARKLPRIGEPSFDKDYYDNNARGYTSRYNSSSSSASTMQSTSRGRSSSGYNNENRMYRRCDSPSNRSQSPRDRIGGNSSGINRNRDLMRRTIESDGYGKSVRRDQRVRERSLVHRSGSHDRSPKDKWDTRNSNRMDRELSTPSFLGRSEPKVKSVGDWTEHISSSGKKYYYNSVTELSQWDKPRAWLEYERTRFGNNNKSQLHPESRHVQQHRGQTASRPQPSARSNNSISYVDESRNRMSSQNNSAPEVISGSHAGTQSSSMSSYYSYGKASATVVSSSEAMEVASSSSLSPTDSLESDGRRYQESTSNTLSENQLQQQQPASGESSSAVEHTGSYSPSDPPTPTQSEQENPSEETSTSGTSGTTSTVALSSNNVTSLSSLGQMTPQRPQMVSLTPSLSKLYRDGLIGHVMGWPAEAVERACLRINDEHQMSNLCVTRVSAELKMARSLVRLAEIQATLQEQRILFLRQESYDLEMMSNKGGSGSSVGQPLLSGDDAVLSATALNSPTTAAKANFWPNVSSSMTTDA